MFYIVKDADDNEVAINPAQVGAMAPIIEPTTNIECGTRIYVNGAAAPAISLLSIADLCRSWGVDLFNADGTAAHTESPPQ